MKKRNIFILALIIGFIFILGDVSSLFAQETETEEFTLEEITVTAQKREENQQKVPIAMDVISGEDLDVMGKDNIDEILKDVANVFINTAADGMRISLRGITDDGSLQNDQHVSGSTVALNIDGAFNNMSSAGQNLFDLERVEVLFGPQSTMYGSNSPGGIVNVITAAPKTDRYSASATIEYGSYNLLNLQGMVNAPVYKDKIALRFAANRSEQGSYTDPDADSNKTTSARLRALWNIYDKLSFTLTTNWNKRGNGGMMGGSVVPFVNQDDVDDPWTAAESDSEGGNRADQITKEVSANIDWETGLGTIAFVPSYSISSSEGKQTEAGGGGGGGGGPAPMSFTGGLIAQQAIFPQQGSTEEEDVFYQESSNTQKGAELRMTNAKDFEWFEWILGGTWYESEQERTRDYEDPTSLDTFSDVYQIKRAVYANITYPLWFHEKLKLTVGYRQSWDENNSLKLESSGPSAGEEAESGNPEGYSKPDLKFGFEYDAADNLMFYGSFSSSYRSGDAAAMPSTHGYPDPEELDSYTAGMKSRWFGNKLQVNVSGYFYDYANKLCTGWKEADATESEIGWDAFGWDLSSGTPQVSDRAGDGIFPTLDTYDADGDGDTTEELVVTIHDQNSQGTGAFTSLGFDLQTSWIITSRDRLNFSVSYLDSQWKTLHFRYQYYNVFPDEDYEGVTPTNSPKWSMTASYQHNFILGSFGTLTPRIDMQHKTSYSMVWNPTDKDPEGYGHQEPYYLWDASASFNHSSGKWSLNAYVKNITNYAVKRSYMGTMSYTMMIGDPRTYGASFSINF